MEGYEINLSKIIIWELTYTCLDERVYLLLDVDHFVMVDRTTNLVLIWDQPNPILKAKVGVSLL